MASLRPLPPSGQQEEEMTSVLQSHIFGNKGPEREVQEPRDANWTSLLQFPARETHSDELADHSGWAERSLSPRKLCGCFCKQAMEKVSLELDAGKESGGSLGVRREGISLWVGSISTHLKQGTDPSSPLTRQPAYSSSFQVSSRNHSLSGSTSPLVRALPNQLNCDIYLSV